METPGENLEGALRQIRNRREAGRNIWWQKNGNRRIEEYKSGDGFKDFRDRARGAVAAGARWTGAAGAWLSFQRPPVGELEALARTLAKTLNACSPPKGGAALTLAISA